MKHTQLHPDAAPAKPKRSRKRDKRAPIGPVKATTLLDRARETARISVESLDACVQRVTGMLATEQYEPRLASHLAYLAKHAIMMLGELRKLEAHDQRAVRAMTTEEKDAQILAYVQEMPRDRRAVIRQALDELDADQLLA